MKRVKKLLTAFSFVLLATVLVACGAAGTTTGSQPPAAPATGNQPSTAAQPPVQGNSNAAPAAGSNTAPSTSQQSPSGQPSSSAQPTLMLADNPTLGQIVVDSKGMTLYAYANDTPSVSTCTGACATIWPPLTVAAGVTPMAGAGVTGTLGTITRADGTLQVTLNGMPLYNYSKDTKAGDTNGQGVGGVWSVVTAAGAPASSSSSQQSSSSSGSSSSSENQSLDTTTVVPANTLKSYQATTTITSSGTSNGQQIQSTFSIQAQYTSNPAAEHLATSGTTNGQAGQPFELYLVGGTEYVNVQGQWESIPATATGNLDLLSGDTLLKNLCGWTKAGTTTVSGVAATDYRLASNALSSCPNLQSSFGSNVTVTKASGDVYIAVDGNYIVKMDVTIVGKNIDVPNFSSGSATTITLDQGTEEVVYVLSDVNQPVNIQLPAGLPVNQTPASVLPSDIPAPSDAKVSGNLAGYIILSTSESVQQVTDFYNTGMIKDGWTLANSSQLPSGAALSFTKGNRSANIIISSAAAAAGTTTITIAVQGG